MYRSTQSVDARLIPCAIGVYAATALGLRWPSHLTHTCSLAALGVALAAASVWWLARRRAGSDGVGLVTRVGVSVVALSAVGASVGWGAAAVHVARVDEGPLVAYAAETRTMHGELTLETPPRLIASDGDDDTRQRWWAKASFAVQCRSESCREHGGEGVSGPVVSFAEVPPGGVLPSAGTTLVVTGRVAAPDEAGSRPAFTVRRVAEVRETPAVARGLAAPRQALVEAAQGVRLLGAGLVPALVVGDESLQDEAATEAMSATGLTHLTAVSGANMAAVAGLAWGLCVVVGVPRCARAVVAGVAVAAYTAVVGVEPSVLRAAVMGFLGVAAVIGGAYTPRGGAVGFAVIVLVTAMPSLAVSPGFALSVVSTLAITLWGPALRRVAERKGVPSAVSPLLAVTVVASAACTPLIAVLDGRVAVWTVLANLCVAVFVPLVTVVGLLGMCLAWIPGVATALVWVAAVPASAVVLVASWFASLPTATVVWPFSAGETSIAVVVVCLVGACVWAVRATVGAGGAASFVRVRGVRILVAGALVLAVVASACLHSSAWPKWFQVGMPPDWAFVVCDVGQGTAVLARTGPDSALVFDTGPRDGGLSTCLRDSGVETVAGLSLSHYHADHVGDVAAVLGEFSVPVMWGSAATQPVRNYRAVAAEADARGMEVSTPERGEAMQAGWARVDFLSRTRQLGCSTDCDGSDINNESLVALVTVERPGEQASTALITGDIETEQQLSLVASGALPRQVDVLMTPHHGSASVHPSFFRAVGARVHAVSVGEDNPYGHPSARTLAILRGVSGITARTDQHGTIAITPTTLHAEHGPLADAP